MQIAVPQIRLVGNPQFNLFQLPPDRSVDDLLASLEGSQSKGTNSGSTRKEKDGLKSAEKGIIANISDDGSDTDDDGNVSLKILLLNFLTSIIVVVMAVTNNNHNKHRFYILHFPTLQQAYTLLETKTNTNIDAK